MSRKSDNKSDLRKSIIDVYLGYAPKSGKVRTSKMVDNERVKEELDSVFIPGPAGLHDDQR